MTTQKTPEEIATEIYHHSFDCDLIQDIVSAMRDCGDRRWNEAIEAAINEFDCVEKFDKTVKCSSDEHKRIRALKLKR
jgi:hypothetical protein